MVVDAAYDALMAALQAQGAVLLDAADRGRLQETLWPQGGPLSAAAIAQAAPVIAQRAALANPQAAVARILMVSETGTGPDHPFSGEKLSPVLAVYRVVDFEAAVRQVADLYAHQGAGHSVSLHGTREDRARRLATGLPVARVIVNQAHCIATGGSFDNGLPFSLSMGCGTWGRNNFSDNLGWRQYVNITRIARPIPERVPTLEEIFGDFHARHGQH